tara:strand:+ start:192 stop:497 length:306 start_codon:yes stop_codon:yes gene_type:complete
MIENPLYLIVHKETVPRPNESSSLKEVSEYNELQRIIEEEEWIHWDGDGSQLCPDLPKDRFIRVCGGLGRLCVKVQFMLLKQKGYNAEIYWKATRKGYEWL